MSKAKTSAVIGMMLALLGGGGSWAAHAAQGDAVRLWRVGKTGIYCVKAPCPWRGVVQADGAGQAVGAPVWSSESLPVLEATPMAAARLGAVWQNFECVLVAGAFDGGVLRVDRLAGAC